MILDCVSFHLNLEFDYVHFGGTGMAKFEIYKDKRKEFRWRLRADNGQIIEVGEGYKSKRGCKNGIVSVKRNAPKADIEDQT